MQTHHAKSTTVNCIIHQSCINLNSDISNDKGLKRYSKPLKLKTALFNTKYAN
jgi:hypothetical protein